MRRREEMLEHLKQALHSIGQQHASSAIYNVEAAMSDDSVVNGRLVSAKHAINQSYWSGAKYDIDMAIAELEHRSSKRATSIRHDVALRCGLRSLDVTE